MLVIPALASAMPALADTLDGSAGEAVPEFSIRRTQATLTIEGPVSSSAHEAQLKRVVAERMSSVDARFDVHPDTPLPADWSLMTMLTLKAMAPTSTSTALVTPSSITLKGVTADCDDWRDALNELQRAASDLELDAGVEEICALPPLKELCRKLFLGTMRGRKLEFFDGSATLRPPATMLLDAVIQLAADCPAARFGIVGHGDARLAVARAETVGAYLRDRGLDASRIAVSNAVAPGRTVMSISFID